MICNINVWYIVFVETDLDFLATLSSRLTILVVWWRNEEQVDCVVLNPYHLFTHTTTRSSPMPHTAYLGSVCASCNLMLFIILKDSRLFFFTWHAQFSKVESENDVLIIIIDIILTTLHLPLQLQCLYLDNMTLCSHYGGKLQCEWDMELLFLTHFV